MGLKCRGWIGGGATRGAPGRGRQPWSGGCDPGPGGGSGAKVKRPGLRVPLGLSLLGGAEGSGGHRAWTEVTGPPRARGAAGSTSPPPGPHSKGGDSAPRVPQEASRALREPGLHLRDRDAPPGGLPGWRLALEFGKSRAGTERPRGGLASAARAAGVGAAADGSQVSWTWLWARPVSRRRGLPSGPESGRGPAWGRALHPRPALPEGGPRDCSDCSAPHEALFPPPSHVRRVASPRKGKKSGANRRSRALNPRRAGGPELEPECSPASSAPPATGLSAQARP